MARKRAFSGVNYIASPIAFDNNTNWFKSAMTVVADQVVAPDGTFTADQLSETASNAYHVVQGNVSVPIVNGSTYVLSCYFKQGTGVRYVAIDIFSAGAGSYAVFDLQNVVVTETGHDSDTLGVTPTITADLNGFYRCSIAFTATRTGTMLPVIFFSSDGTYAGGSYLGNAANNLYAWGMQYEPGTVPSAFFNPAAARSAIGGRQNLFSQSEDQSNANWTKGTGVTATANSLDVSPPTSAPNAAITKLAYDGSGTASGLRVSQTALTPVAGPVLYTVAVWLRVSSGSRNVSIIRGFATATVTLTTTWQRLLVTNYANGNGLLWRISGDGSDNAALTIYMTMAQGGRASGDFPYVKTTTTAVNTSTGKRKLVSGRSAKSNRKAA